jgi:hypothetical protein
MVEMVEGAHYRLDGGEEIGPALYLPRSAQDEKPWSVGGLWYRDDGRYRYGGNSSTVDLIEMTFDPRKDAASDRLTALEARVAELDARIGEIKEEASDKIKERNAPAYEFYCSEIMWCGSIIEAKNHERLERLVIDAFNAGRKFEKESGNG